jgi:multicomponent Na+:H+ antiporter subunit E
MSSNGAARAARWAALFCWAFLVWVLLTWTLTAEQLLFGAGVAAAVAVALFPLGAVPGPWRLLDPRLLVGLVVLLAVTGGRIVISNLRLARRIWAPSRPLSSGMVVATTDGRSPGWLTALGLMTSVVVDNQLVDLDADRGELQYHAVEIPPGGRDGATRAITGPAGRLLDRLVARTPGPDPSDSPDLPGSPDPAR